MKLGSNLEFNGNNIVKGNTIVVPTVEDQETLALVSDLSSLATKQELQNDELVLTTAINSKQDALTAGSNIDITSNVIKAKGYDVHLNSSGKYTFLEGEGSGRGSLAHAEGTSRTTQSASHAEGGDTICSGGNSHTEGEYSAIYRVNNISETVYCAHAEGAHTTASGNGSHSEGGHTLAKGTYSHAEGGLMKPYSLPVSSTTFTRQSASIFVLRTASSFSTDNIGHVLINYEIGAVQQPEVMLYVVNVSQTPVVVDNTTLYDTTFTINPFGAGTSIVPYLIPVPNIPQDAVITEIELHYYSNIAEGISSHAEGQDTLAEGIGSHAEGNSTYAKGDYSHAEGQGSVIEIENVQFSKRTHNSIEFTGNLQITIHKGDILYYIDQNSVKQYIKINSSVLDGTVIETATDLTNLSFANVIMYKIEQMAGGNNSHAEGYNTITFNTGEHAEGKYNYPIIENSVKTISTIGIGANGGDRQNAVAVLDDGKVFIKGVGSYQGTSTTNTYDLADVISTLTTNYQTLLNLVYRLHPEYNITTSNSMISVQFMTTDGEETVTKSRAGLQTIGMLVTQSPISIGDVIEYQINNETPIQMTFQSGLFPNISFRMPYEDVSINLISITPAQS